MEIRKLRREEHGRTQKLYEEIFSEDAGSFADYYYKWKIRDNDIYVAEDGEGIHAMVHLNPFLVSVKGEIRKLHYIVAVATQEEYRHRGLMKRLLSAAEQDMKNRGECFTFLMPASEQIYYPFGYRFFSSQRRGELYIEETDLKRQEGQKAYRKDCGQAECRPVREEEYGRLACFVNETLGKQYEVFIYRDEKYYERLCAQQECQDGAVMVIFQKDRLIGTFCTAKEESSVELQEVILSKDALEEGQNALQDFALSLMREGKKCTVCGCTEGVLLKKEKRVMLLMGKVPEGGEFCCEWEEDRIFINEAV